MASKYKIRKAAVIGAGVMGRGIAALLAGVGIPVYLLDIVPPDLTEEEKKDPKARNRFALNAIQGLLKSKPPQLFSKNDVKLITPGNMEDNLEWLGDADWIVEVVVESPKIKQQVFKTVEKYRRPGSIVTSNTSGIPLSIMSQGRSDEFKKHFMITHFFNPPRYMKLLELVVGEETDPEVVAFMKDFGENVLGKGIVFAKDTPNFIANRIGTFGLMDAVWTMLNDGYQIDEVDYITGKAMGRPRSATFGTGDLVGIDTLVHVVENIYDVVLGDEQREMFRVPDFIKKMVEKGLLGKKSGAGFYKKTKDEKGKTVRLVIDPETLEYRPVEEYYYESVEAAKSERDPRKQIKILVEGADRGADFAWKIIRDTLIYSAYRLGEIADDIVNIDNAMKWGFNWKLGPFEIWDAIGVRDSIERMEAEGYYLPESIKDVITKGYGHFYVELEGKKYYFDFVESKYKPVPTNPHVIVIKNLKDEGKIIEENESASLIDLGDGIGLVEFHTKMNSTDDKIIAMIHKAIDMLEDDKLEGLVIGSQARNFSAGANIFMILTAAQQKQFDMLNQVVKSFQDMNMRMKYAPKPIVVAPYDLTLGGGAEITMHAHKVQADMETYMGLVEVGVGLIPGGGGNKEVYLRSYGEGPVPTDPYKIPQHALQAAAHALELIGMAKVAVGAKEAMDWGLLRKTDNITMNQDRLIYDAKQTVLAMIREGFKPRHPLTDIPVCGREGIATLTMGIKNMLYSGYITEYDEFIARKLIFVLSGGDVIPGTTVSEQHLLDLEREAFLSLCGEKKTQDRLQYMLQHNKPLRN